MLRWPTPMFLPLWGGCASEATAAMALEFTIPTGARSGETLGGLGGIRLDAKVWTVPANRMKAGRIHRVPLSERAAAIVKKLSEARTSDRYSPASRKTGRFP